MLHIYLDTFKRYKCGPQGQKEKKPNPKHCMVYTVELMNFYSLYLTRHQNLACKMLKEGELVRQGH